MTPEERQRTIDFILASLANSAIRTDRIEEIQKRHEEAQKRIEEEQREFDRRMTQLREEHNQQKVTVDGLLRVTHDLVKISENVVDRTKLQETRSDSVEEMIKILRELLEANLRRPDNPRQNSLAPVYFAGGFQLSRSV